MDEQYIDVISVQCTLPNNFQLCNAFENGLCFSGCGTCNTKNTEQVIQPDNGGKCTRPENKGCPSRERGRCVDETPCPPLQVN